MAEVYWYGGAGNWSDYANHWSNNSGNIPASNLGRVPNSTDNVHFNSLSNTTAYTVTLDATGTRQCQDLNFDAQPAVSGIVTFAGNNAMTIYGNIKFLAGMGYTVGVALTMGATSGTKTITSAGISPTLIFDGVGGTFQLLDDFSTYNNITLTNGTFDANGKTVTLSTGTGLKIIGSFTFFNLTILGVASKTGTLTITGSQTVTNLFTATGNSNINRLLIQSNIVGTPVTITAASIAVDKCDFQDITGAGVASWDMSAAAGYTGNCGGNTMKALGDAAFTAPATQTATGTASFTWSTHGWTSRVPLPQDDVSIPNSFVAGRTITADMPRLGKSITCSCSGSPTFSISTNSPFNYGSLNLTGLATPTSGANTWTLAGRGSYTITMGGTVLSMPLKIQAPSGTYQLQDSFVSNNTISNYAGTFDTNSQSVKCLTYGNLGGTLTLGTTTIELTTTSATTAWSWTSGTLTSAPNSTIKISGSTTNIRTFTGGSQSYGNLWFSNATINGQLTISGNNTFNDIKCDTPPQTIVFTAASTTHCTTFTVNGTAGNLITINSSSTATFSLIKDGGGTISCSYLSIQHSVATPANTWTALYSTDNNSVVTAGSGWTIYAGNLFLRTPSDSIMVGASRTVDLGRIYGALRSSSDSILSGASRAVTLGRVYNSFRGLTASIINGTGRLSTVSRLGHYARTQTDNILSGASRTTALTRMVTMYRSAADSIINGALRLTTISSVFHHPFFKPLASIKNGIINAFIKKIDVPKASNKNIKPKTR